MLSKKLLDELNLQIRYEWESAHYYMAMAAYLDSEDLPGFAHFFKVQEEEERFHAEKFYNYINEMDGTVKVTSLDLKEDEFTSPLDVFEKALEHEKFVTSRIYHLMDIAMEEKEHATISMLKWFIDEQVEEENSMKEKISKLKRIENNSNALYQMDTELSQRVFVKPTEN